MMKPIQKALRLVLNNRAVSLGSIAALTLVLTGVLSTTPAMNDVAVAAAPTEQTIATTAAHSVTITADGKTTSLPFQNGTVADALDLVNIVLGEDDRVSPSLTTPLKDGITITVTRISFVERVELESIPFETKEEKDADLAVGKKEIKQHGANGICEKVYCDKVVNGKVESSKVLRSSVVSEATTEIVRVGTKKSTPVTTPAGVVVDANGVPQNYKTCLTGIATAYTSDRGNAGTVTASGMTAQVGVVAVDPSIIPLGTKLYIASPDGSVVYGYAIAGDTGGAMYSGDALVDLFYDTYEECIQFGRRTMNIYILE